VIEIPTFHQILEMDDDEEDRDFSKSIVYDFFEQAEGTFAKMDSALYVSCHATIFKIKHQIRGRFLVTCSNPFLDLGQTETCINCLNWATS
jgi:hypothetical protein